MTSLAQELRTYRTSHRLNRRLSRSAGQYYFYYPRTAPTEIYTLSLHDALPICSPRSADSSPSGPRRRQGSPRRSTRGGDRKSTRLNSSHVSISYAVFCLKKKRHYHMRSTTSYNTNSTHYLYSLRIATLQTARIA